MHTIRFSALPGAMRLLLDGVWVQRYMLSTPHVHMVYIPITLVHSFEQKYVLYSLLSRMLFCLTTAEEIEEYIFPVQLIDFRRKWISAMAPNDRRGNRVSRNRNFSVL